MRVRGSYVILKNITHVESKIELSETQKRAMMEEKIEMLDRLPISHVGEQVEDLNVGDEVFVDPMVLMNSSRLVVEGKSIIIVRGTDIKVVY
jgi:hypothetical protein